MQDQKVEVRDNPAASRLEINMGNGLAVADYEIADGTMTITHTVVPTQFGGRGYGGLLAAAAMDKARREDLKIIPQCSFIHAYMQKHPETRALAHPSVSFAD